MQPELIEWVVRVGRRDFYLTDKQHQALIKAKTENIKMVLFEGFTINPAFYEYSFKQKKQRKQCLFCGGVGYTLAGIENNLVKTIDCVKCSGRGVI
jgi:hypothetical protein